MAFSWNIFAKIMLKEIKKNYMLFYKVAVVLNRKEIWTKYFPHTTSDKNQSFRWLSSGL
jgi:hypothetical protein